MNIGAMRERVKIQAQNSTTDTGGDMGARVWSDVITTWAEVVPMSGSERLRAASMGSSVTYRLTLRDRSDVTAKHQIVCLGPDYKNSTMQIHAVVRDHAKDRLILDCSELI